LTLQGNSLFQFCIDTKVPLEAFFDIVAFGVNNIIWLSKHPAKLFHDFICFLQNLSFLGRCMLSTLATKLKD